MKVKQIGKGTTSSTGIASMPNELRNKLHDMTINDALAKGIITDVGTPTGVFAVPHKDENISRWYGIVEGFAVPLSKTASENAEEGKLNDDLIGTMKFQKGISNQAGDGFGKEWFNLGMGGTLNLDLESEDAVKLGANPVATKA